MEERIERLEESQRQQQAASITLLDIVKGIDRNVTALVGAVRSIQAHEAIVDARLNTVDARLNAMHRDMEASFRQIATTMSMKDDLADLESRMDERMHALDVKLDTVIALLTQKQGE